MSDRPQSQDAASAKTYIEPSVDEKPPVHADGEGQSAIPADKKEEAYEDAEEDWAHDPRNARNWPFWTKWAMTGIVSGGWVGSAAIAIGGGVIGDLFSERDRATAMAIYSLGPLIGPAIGPIAGGFIAETIGWKYIFIVITAVCGLASLVGIPFLRETYSPIIRLRLARNMDREEALRRHPHLIHAHDENKWQHLWENLSRPFVLLTRSFICFILSLYMALMYGIYYLMFATFPTLFTEIYHFNTGTGGLAYLGLGIGFLLSTVFGAKYADQIYKMQVDKNGGVGKPEMRIPALIIGSFFVPTGLFWYGWSAQAQIHWIMPIIGSGIFGFGLMATFLPIQLYLVDAFTYAASAVSAAAVFRSMLGFAFPLFGAQMYAALGRGGGNSLLAGLAIILSDIAYHFTLRFPLPIGATNSDSLLAEDFTFMTFDSAAATSANLAHYLALTYIPHLELLKK
ncbi:hypothetical protein EWM64_g1411 [Hericium alpestre]|uniref:Major facilitator superfamily (MFS) profile domain-containing protein n=1 Tax=Hericium alpestre TaxID=135208 RepID=A0A4Z0A789_9AGAM|nr:hypothetical protein EWM64_g1411 [Hericium alpestre]